MTLISAYMRTLDQMRPAYLEMGLQPASTFMTTGVRYVCGGIPVKICMIGAGYVGLVSGACFAEFGCTVTCIDKDPDRIARLKRGEVLIYEPGLDDLLQRNAAASRLHFSTSLCRRGRPSRARVSRGWDADAPWRWVCRPYPHLRGGGRDGATSQGRYGHCDQIDRACGYQPRD